MLRNQDVARTTELAGGGLGEMTAKMFEVFDVFKAHFFLLPV